MGRLQAVGNQVWSTQEQVKVTPFEVDLNYRLTNNKQKAFTKNNLT